MTFNFLYLHGNNKTGVMKQLMICALLGSLVFSGFAQVTTPAGGTTETPVNPNAPEIVFDHESYDFGEIEEGTLAEHEFEFSNTGKEPLILQNVRASCGCTTPSWPKEPILPGQKGKIKAVYNSKGRPGGFNKSITVTSNAKTATKVIYIKGTVRKAEVEKTVPEKEPVLIKTPNY